MLLLGLLLFSLGTFCHSLSPANLPSNAFHITKILGSGSFGAVFKAYLRGTKKEFALKFSISVNDDADPVFENELNTLKILHTKVSGTDQHFLGLLSSEFQQSQYVNFSQALVADSPCESQPLLLHNRHIFQDYARMLSSRRTKALVFPLYEGKDLHSLLLKMNYSSRERQLTDWEFYSLALGIVRALQVLHGLGYVHRDLKPENIMLDTSRPIPGSDIGQPVLIDFGHARKIGIEAHYSGTTGYIAPEFKMSSCACSSANDVFSFGSIFKQLQSRRIILPYDLMKMQKKLWNRKSPDHDLVSRCWSRDPTQRPTLDEIAQELQKFCRNTNSCSSSSNISTRKSTLASLMKEHSP